MTSKAPTDWNNFVAQMMPVLCAIEREKSDITHKRLPSELIVEIARLWDVRKNAMKNDSNAINTRVCVSSMRGIWV